MHVELPGTVVQRMPKAFTGQRNTNTSLRNYRKMLVLKECENVILYSPAWKTVRFPGGVWNLSIYERQWNVSQLVGWVSSPVCT
jgi:hypothetical protein